MIPATDEKMNIVIAGHVDHGKSTVIGRLLADTDSLPQGKLQQIQELCRRTSKPFEYAFLLDALKDEQAQGITIDSARIFFKSARRHYLILVAPGHIEFLRNMVTGASHAEAAVLVIDAAEGVRENSRRHGYMLSMLGIRQLTVAINKMDLDYSRPVFDAIVQNTAGFKRNRSERLVIPVSGMQGDTSPSPAADGLVQRADCAGALDALSGAAAAGQALGCRSRMFISSLEPAIREGSSPGRWRPERFGRAMK